MKVLLVAATEYEIAPFLSHFKIKLDSPSSLYQIELRTLITGAGIINSCYYLTDYLSSNKPDIVINVGIAGAISKDLNIAEVVRVDNDTPAYFGAEDDKNFLPAFELGLVQKEEDSFYRGELQFDTQTGFRSIDNLKKVDAITVQKVHGNEQSITQLKRDYPQASIETMEGAAVLYVCAKKNVKCAQLRSISNYVEKRNRDAWEIDKAIKSLNDLLIEAFSQ